MEVFISYDHSDQWFIDLLTPMLRDNGYDPLVLNLQAQFGDKIYDRVSIALRNCNHAFVVLSKSYTESVWFEEELAALFIIEKTKKPNLILPILLDDCKVPGIIRSRPFADLRDLKAKEDPKRLTAEEFRRVTSLVTVAPQQVFVIMKYADPQKEPQLARELEKVYDRGMEPVIRRFGYVVVRVDKIHECKKITDQILSNLERSEVVLADLTGERPNCYYEAGYAHALQKEMIFTIKKGEPVHFDVAGYRFIEWTDYEHLATELEKYLKSIQEKNANMGQCNIQAIQRNAA